MEFFDVLYKRRSIRSFTEEPVSREDIEVLLRAAMVAPTAHNAQNWRFIVVDDKELLYKVPLINPYARMARRAPLGILVCGDLQTQKVEGFWLQNCCAAIENILLAVTGLGLGAVWTGISEQYSDSVLRYQELFHLPQHIMPAGFLIIGHGKKEAKSVDRFDSTKVHYNVWGNVWETSVQEQ